MKRVLRMVARLYPRPWRERYGEEFAALLEDARPGWRGLMDVLFNAFRMRAATASFRAVVAMGLLGLIVAGILVFRMPQRYVSETVMRIETSPAPSHEAAMRRLHQMQGMVLSRTSLSRIIPELDLYHHQRTKLPLENVIDQMRTRDLHFTDLPCGGCVAFRMSYTGENAALAQRTVQKLLTRFVDANVESQRRPAVGPRASRPMVETMDILKPPDLSSAPVPPPLWRFLLTGLAGGLLIGVLFCGARSWPRHTMTFGGALAFVSAILLVIPVPYSSHGTLLLDNDQMVNAVLHDGTLAAQLRDVRLMSLPGHTLRIESSTSDPVSAQVHVQFAIVKIVEFLIRTDRQGPDVLEPPSRAVLPAGMDTPWRWWLLSGGTALALLSLFFSRRQPAPIGLQFT